MKQETINNSIDTLTHLDGLLNDRAEEYSKAKGYMQAVHAYRYYRTHIETASRLISAGKYKESFEILENLARMFDQRIEDLHEVKGTQHYRHAFILYRRLVWDAWFPLRDELNKKKK
jgi:hypothetical protein